jgi:hypothetical protein
MNLFKTIFGEIKPEAPWTDNGQGDRLEDIKAEYAAGEITKEQYDDLMTDESITANYIRLKRVALAVFCAGIGFLLLW